jgi:pyruvyl transferase EpsO
MHQAATGNAIVDEMRSLVADTFQTLIPAKTPCALVDFPDHPNVGDSAIWLGERAALSGFGVPIVYTCSTRNYSETELRSRVQHGTILIHGGGNLGDIWPHHEELREAVIRAFPDNKIIQLPQTMWFGSADSLARARAVFNGHPDLTILARDERSLELARNEFRVASMLCPDAAFVLGPIPRPRAPTHDLICLLRSDIESAVPQTEDPGRIVDWLEEPESPRLRINRWCYRHRARSPLRPLVQLFHTTLWDGLARERLRRGCRTLSDGRVVITDRLHGHILCLLLDIPHIMLDNTYGKLRSFFETWTRNSPLAHWARSLGEATGLARHLMSSS